MAFLAVARAQKVAVEGVNDTGFRHGLFCRIQRLSHHLAAKHLAQAEIFTLAAKQAFFQFFPDSIN